MCGIFGFIGKTNSQTPDMELFREIASAAVERGKHAHGFAWVDKKTGKVTRYRAPGSMAKHLDKIERVKDASLVIGHTRLATHGSPKKNANNHPHTAGDDGFIVHNGVIDDYKTLADGLPLVSQCDSEVISAIAEHLQGAKADRLARYAEAVDLIANDFAVMAVWENPRQIFIARRGRELYFIKRREGVYLSQVVRPLAQRPNKLHKVTECVAEVVTQHPAGIQAELKRLTNKRRGWCFE